MRTPRSGRHSTFATRHLRFEALEHRALLTVGSVVHDADGDLFTVDLNDNLAVSFLGRMDEVMLDVAFSPGGDLWGVADLPPEQGGHTGLYRIHADLDNPSATIDVELVDVLHVSAIEWIWVNSLEFNAGGELFTAGYNDAGEEYVYSVDTDTAEANEQVAIPGHRSAGDIEFDSDGDLYLTTEDGDLLGIGPELDSFTVVGSIGLGDVYGLIYGPGPVLYGFQESGDVVQISTDDATVTPVGTLLDPSLQAVNGAATLYPAPTALGEVDFLVLENQMPTLGEMWYGVEAAHDAYFTVELPGLDPASGAELTLYQYGPGQVLEELAAGDDRLDYELGAAGDVYFIKADGVEPGFELRITNLVGIVPDGATVYGTDDDDTFAFTKGSPYLIVINGVEYRFGFTNLPKAMVTFTGGLGHDTAVLTGSNLNEDAVLDLGAHTGSLAGAAYEVSVSGTPDITVDGRGGFDEAALTGSAGDDVLRMEPKYARLTGSGALLLVTDVRTIEATAGGGSDLAILYDSEDWDTLVADPASATLSSGVKYSSTATGFEAVHAHSVSGGFDRAELGDSSGADLFVGRKDSAVLKDLAGTYYLRANRFNEVTATSDGHPDDRALLFDSARNDTLLASPEEARLSGAGFSNTGIGFAVVDAYGNGGGSDVADLSDSPDDDTFTAFPALSTLTGTGYTLNARGFESVFAAADAGGTGDTAILYDSRAADTFVGRPDSGRLRGPGFFIEAKYFDFVHAVSRFGGGDEAYLFGSAGDDTLVSRDRRVGLSGPGYSHQVWSFEKHYALAGSGGTNEAYLFASLGAVDLLTARDNWAKLDNNELGTFTQATRFGTVVAYARGEGDQRDVIGPLAFTPVWVGAWVDV